MSIHAAAVTPDQNLDQGSPVVSDLCQDPVYQISQSIYQCHANISTMIVLQASPGYWPTVPQLLWIKERSLRVVTLCQDGYSSCYGESNAGYNAQQYYSTVTDDIRAKYSTIWLTADTSHG